MDKTNMKLLLPVLFVLAFLFTSCGKKEENNLQLFGTSAFTFDTGAGWEVNVSTRVKGFKQEDRNGKFRASFAYTMDLIKPSGDTIKALINKVEDKSESEKVADTPIESQFDLDSTYAVGNYKLIINVKDVISDKTTSSSTQFELKKD